MRVTSNGLIFVIVVASALFGCKDDEPSGSSGAGGAGGTTGGSGGASGMSGASGGGGMSASGGTGGGTESEQTCATLCARVDPLDCRNDTEPCMAECLGLYDGMLCQAQIRALFQCGAAAAPSDWECNGPSGEAETKAGVCDAELGALESCLNA